MILKELLLVLRDKHALAVLFVMPAIFILIMSVALRDQFEIDKIDFSVAIEDHDRTKLSQNFIKKLKSDDSFVMTHENEADFVIQIPKDIKKNDKKITIIVKGAIKNDFLEIFKAKLLRQIVDFKLAIVSKKIKVISTKAAAAVDVIRVSDGELFIVEYENIKQTPNSTQQIVPTWIVFGLFFVIIPMSTIYINERKQNTLLRLSSMNVSITAMILSKMAPYMIINYIQVWIMLAVGMYLVPYLDTPALVLNGSIAAITLLSIALSFSAIGLATLIAVSATSAEQATTIGGVLNILLGAVGGIMIPKFLMPETMQRFAEISPMSWGLDGFLEIFLQASSITGVFNESGKLALFGIVCLMSSIVILKTKLNKGL